LDYSRNDIPDRGSELTDDIGIICLPHLLLDELAGRRCGDTTKSLGAIYYFIYFLSVLAEDWNHDLDFAGFAIKLGVCMKFGQGHVCICGKNSRLDRDDQSLEWDFSFYRERCKSFHIHIHERSSPFRLNSIST
jgi:hypothetical protein